MVTANTITIDVANDLKDTSHLKDLISGNQKPVFQIASELASFAGKPISAASGATPAKISIKIPGQWKTSTGIGFGLSAAATCGVSVSNQSTKFPISKSIDSEDTEDECAGPLLGMVYINIELDFEIDGSVSGSGKVGAVGISGKATGSAVRTFCYCHPIDSGTETIAALKEAFSSLILPFQPDCALVMPVGAICRVNFDGSLGFKLEASYGLGSFKFSAPGLDAAKGSLKVGADNFSIPDAQVDAGIKASFGYTHADHFGLIVKRLNANNADLDIVRSAKNETDESVGITVGVSAANGLTTSLDQAKLAQAIDSITKVNGSGAKVAGVADQMQSSLVSKANQWLSGEEGDAGLLVSLSQQTNRAMLYRFSVDLAEANLTRDSWTSLAGGDLLEAINRKGMTLLPGSGVGSELSRNVSVGLHFFNLFKATDISTYFRNSYVEIGPDGNLRFMYDIGNEDEQDTKNAIRKCRFHFVATANPGSGDTVRNADVSLYIELSESKDPAEAQKIASSIGSLGSAVKDAQNAMIQFVNNNKNGTLNLVNILKPSAYVRLACSQYVGRRPKPPANPQYQDSVNFMAFQTACVSLLQWSWLTQLSYPDWVHFNKYCIGAVDPSDGTLLPDATPDRRALGNPAFVPPSFFLNRQSYQTNITYYYPQCAGFMNLCDNLHTLAGLVATLDKDETVAEWNDLLDSLGPMVKNSLDVDLTKATVSALLQLCMGASVSTSQQSDKSKGSLTCTVTLT